MNIQEAIRHCDEKTNCTECGQQHKQLGQWLRELLTYRATQSDERMTNNTTQWIPCRSGCRARMNAKKAKASL